MKVIKQTFKCVAGSNFSTSRYYHSSNLIIQSELVEVAYWPILLQFDNNFDNNSTPINVLIEK